MMGASRKGRKESNPKGDRPGSTASPKFHPRVLLVYLGLAVATFAVYGQVFEFEFVNWDDQAFVHANPHVTSGLSWDNFVWSFGIHGPGQWHPVSWWVYQLNCQLFGVHPGWHHLVCVLLHVAAALALLTAFWRLTGDFWPSALVAALFALHPLNVESVAWVSHLRDPLSTLFWALVMWSYAVYARRGGPWRYLLVVLLFALGLMAKPMLITLPCVLLLLDYWPLRRVDLGTWSLAPEPGGIGQEPGVRSQESGGGDREDGLRSETGPRKIGWLLIEKVPLFVLTGVSIWLSYLCQRTMGAVVSLDAHPLGARLANAAQSYVLYLRNMMWPAWLAIMYPLPKSFHPLLVSGAVAFLLAATGIAIYFARRKPYLLVGWLWYLGTLVPVIGILKMGELTSMTDHYAYVSLLGIFMAIAWTLTGLVRNHPTLRPAVIGLVTVVLLGLLPVTWRQTGVWRDSKSLWQNSLSRNAENHIAHINLGAALLQEDRIEEAKRHYYEALRIQPESAKAHNNLALALQKQKKISEAIDHYELALQSEPDHAGAHNNLGLIYQNRKKIDAAISHFQQALRSVPEFAEAHYNLGVARRQQGQLDEAIKHYQEALRIRPDFAVAHNSQGLVLEQQGKTTEAIQQFRLALQVKPDLARARFNLAKILQLQGQSSEAIDHYQQALQNDPGNAEAHNNLGTLLQKQGDFAKAIRHYYQALQIKPNYARAHRNLGTALQGQGMLDEAIQCYLRALRIDPNYVMARNNLAVALQNQGKLAEAIQHYRHALRVKPDYVMARQNLNKLGIALDTIATQHAKAGRTGQAIEAASRAFEAAAAAGNQKLAREIGKRLEAYRNRNP